MFFNLQINKKMKTMGSSWEHRGRRLFCLFVSFWFLVTTKKVFSFSWRDRIVVLKNNHNVSSFNWVHFLPWSFLESWCCSSGTSRGRSLLWWEIPSGLGWKPRRSPELDDERENVTGHVFWHVTGTKSHVTEEGLCRAKISGWKIRLWITVFLPLFLFQF